jgi:Zn-finger nucleic acid-binding protein
MQAETLNCPMCGAPASTDATRCEHCGARLATVACPSCFGMMFVGAKFCSHCGAPAARAEVAGAAPQLCPRCRTELEAVAIGSTSLRECPKCEGIWADAAALSQICADRERQAAVLGMASNLPADESGEPEKVRYLPCPVCAKLMNRVNFAHCSHVVVDVCMQHGTWFDKDELRRIVEFIRAGGLDAARAREIAELEQQRHELKAAQTSSAWDSRTTGSSAKDYDGWGTGISAAAEVLKLLFGR